MNQQEKLDNTIKKIKLFDKIRIVCLCASVVGLAVIWLLGKFYETAAWYEGFSDGLLAVISLALVLVAVSTFVKFFYFNKYKILKQKMK